LEVVGVGLRNGKEQLACPEEDDGLVSEGTVDLLKRKQQVCKSKGEDIGAHA
jgi:hypothetical protein